MYNVGSLAYRNVRLWGHWEIGTLGYRNNKKSELWGTGMLDYRNNGLGLENDIIVNTGKKDCLKFGNSWL